MFKVMAFLKRRPGMSIEEFRDYYENNHRRVAEKHVRGARRYVRRYLEPFPDKLTGELRELDFDVVTELWFDDRAAFEAAFEHASSGDAGAEIAADEENLFDRSKNSFATVVEFDSELA